MKYICDGPGGTTWFRIETEAESSLMAHAVSTHFCRARDAAAAYKPATTVYIEQKIGLAAHLQRTMPLFLTLRQNDGTALVTAMLPPEDENEGEGFFRKIIVGAENADPYVAHQAAIENLGRHFGLALARADCFPYVN